MNRRLEHKLNVEYLPLDSLKEDPRNARRHSDRQINQLARNIEAFGFSVPALIDQNYQIIAGHARCRAARKLGLTVIPVIRLEHLAAAQALAFAIADNRLAELAEWDDQLLAETLKDLVELNLDFDVEVTGFSMAEIDLKIASVSETTEGEPDPADELPPALDDHPITQPGDVWLLPPHRLLCASALDAAALGRLMQGAPAQLVFTDQPYNVPIEGHVSGKGQVHHREFAMAVGEMSSSEFTAFLIQLCLLLRRHLVDGALAYLCIDWRHLFEMLTAGQAAFSSLKNICVWVKSNAGMGSLYRSRHELVVVFKHGKSAHRNNIELGRFGRNRTNVWEYAGTAGFGRQGEEGNLAALHPTVKPVQMVADAILDCSARGDIVLDPFLGSGTTLIAAERVGRVCYGIEIDPLYVDLAIRRWQRHTGQVAVHAGSGRSFDELALAAGAHHG